jgi:hypothetical protein
VYRYKKVLSGNFKRKDVEGISYIVAEEKDIKPRQIEFSDSHKSELIEQFISMDFMNIDEILGFTKKYGPIFSMGLEAFKASAEALGQKLPVDLDEIYPLKEMFSFSEYDFKYFHELVINIWNLQNDIAKKGHDKKILWDFFQLVFQPYGWCEPYPRFLGLPSDKPLAMFAELYHEIMGGEINSDQTSNFLAVILRELGVHLGLKTIKIKGKDIECDKIKLSDKYKKYLEDIDFYLLIYIMVEIRGTGIFDYLECDFEEFSRKFNLKNINDDIFQKIRNLGGVLICDIINDYISSTGLSINENGDFVMEIGDKFLMNIIFDELAVLCQFYETRKCKFRKCHKYFIAKKGKEKNYCCKDCADKEIKYQIREVRRSKRERSC